MKHEFILTRYHLVLLIHCKDNNYYLISLNFQIFTLNKYFMLLSYSKFLESKKVQKITGKIYISIEFEETKHSKERQYRHCPDDKTKCEKYITDGDIKTTLNKAVAPLSKLLIDNTLDVGNEVIITFDNLNVVCKITKPNDDKKNDFKLIIKTVMTKKDFKPGNTYHLKI